MNGLRGLQDHLGVQDYVRMVTCSKIHYAVVTDLPCCSNRGKPAVQYFCEAFAAMHNRYNPAFNMITIGQIVESKDMFVDGFVDPDR